MSEKAINGHKLLAMGEEYPSGDFGIEKLASVEGKVSPERHLKDDERGARSPIKGNQANPDHGWK